MEDQQTHQQTHEELTFEEFDSSLLDTQFQHSSPWSNRRILDVMDVAFQNVLTRDSPRAQQPKGVLLPLKAHQLALIEGMRRKEYDCMNGFEYNGSRTYTNYGILGDDVGTGKSLVVLGFLASLKEKPLAIAKKNKLYSHSSPNLFTVETCDFSNKQIPGTNLLVVPHTIFKQWQVYCQKQTTLNVFYGKTAKDFLIPTKPEEREVFRNSFVNADLVLISNTLYPQVQILADDLRFRWKHIFIDEADSIHITGSQRRLNGLFTWFITATWPNFVLEGCNARPTTLLLLEETPEKYTPLLKTWLQNELGIQSGSNTYGKYTSYMIRSRTWLREYQSEHVLRGHMVLHSHPEFLKESEHMPPIHHQTILCEQARSHRVVRGLVNAQVQSMLDAGNVDGALEQLGVSTMSAGGLVDAVTKERKNELERLEKTLAFKKEMNYSSPLAKEQTLANLQSKIDSVKEQLKTLETRLGQNETTEECPICYENAKENNCTLTPCCHRMFCGACILTSLTRQPTCPMCRADMNPSKLVHVKPSNDLVPSTQQSSEPSKPVLLSKPRQLLEFLKANPTARVLIFSRYENPFLSLGLTFAHEGISHHILRGNKDVVANIIKSFETGEKRVLFLSTESAGAGINLVSATHVVLLHAMTPDEEKQVIGRAYRLGRKDDLHVVHLLHEGETVH